MGVGVVLSQRIWVEGNTCMICCQGIYLEPWRRFTHLLSVTGNGIPFSYRNDPPGPYVSVSGPESH